MGRPHGTRGTQQPRARDLSGGAALTMPPPRRLAERPLRILGNFGRELAPRVGLARLTRECGINHQTHRSRERGHVRQPDGRGRIAPDDVEQTSWVTYLTGSVWIDRPCRYHAKADGNRLIRRFDEDRRLVELTRLSLVLKVAFDTDVDLGHGSRNYKIRNASAFCPKSVAVQVAIERMRRPSALPKKRCPEADQA